MAQNIHSQIQQETLQSGRTREHLFPKIEKYLEGRRLVTFFTSFSYPVQIDDDDVDMLQSVLQQLDLSKGLALMIGSPGGDGLAAERIVNACKAYSGTDDYWALVPGKAKSAATMICLGASKILMAPPSELGPVDPQVPVMVDGRWQYFSAHGLVNGYDDLFTKAVRTKGRLEPFIQQLDHYDARNINNYKSAISLSEDITLKLLKKGMMKRKSISTIKKDIKVFLDPAAGTLAHGRPIFVQEAKGCGIIIDELDVNSTLWKEMYQLYSRTDQYVSRQVAKVVESRADSFFVSPPPQGA